jgi:hypothetical protein
MSLAGTFALLCLLIPQALAGQGLDTATARGGYFDTAWPSEHADLWRSHAAQGAGLPAGFDPATLTVTQASLDLPVWGYTRAKDEVFVIGGSPFTLSTFTQSMKTGKPVRGVAAFFAMAGDLLSGSRPYLAKIRPSDMSTTITPLTGGSTVNYTGGLLMHRNGSVYAVARSMLYKIDPQTMMIEKSVKLPLVEGSSFWTTYNGLQVLPSGELVLKGFHMRDSARTPGWLLLVDPESLAIDVKQGAYVSSARLMIGEEPEGRTWLYHVNALESLRYEVTARGFAIDSGWTRPYRAATDKSSQASSPLLFGTIGQVVFADNTAPGATTPIKLYTQAASVPEKPGSLDGRPAFSESLPGYNFFMVAGDPYNSQLCVYYDPINALVSAHRVKPDGSLEPVWERSGYRASASPALVPDRDLLYIDDWKDGHDHLVVLRLSSGEELASLALSAKLPTIGTIFPGMNGDVYLLSSEAGGGKGLISRIFIQSTDERSVK